MRNKKAKWSLTSFFGNNKPKSNINNANVAKEEKYNIKDLLNYGYSNANSSAIKSLMDDTNKLRKKNNLPEIDPKNLGSIPVFYLSPNKQDRDSNAQKSFLDRTKDRRLDPDLLSAVSKGDNGFYDPRYNYIGIPFYPKPIESYVENINSNEGKFYTQAVKNLLKNGYLNKFTKQHEINHAIDHSGINNIGVTRKIFNVNDNYTPIGTNGSFKMFPELFPIFYNYGRKAGEATNYASAFARGLRNIYFKDNKRFPTPDELKAEAKTLLNSSDEDIMQYIINNKDSIKYMDPFLRYIEFYKNGMNEDEKLKKELDALDEEETKKAKKELYDFFDEETKKELRKGEINLYEAIKKEYRKGGIDLDEEPKTKRKMIEILPFLVKNKSDNINNMKFASLKTIKNKNDKNIINGNIAAISSQALKRFLIRKGIS